MLLCSTVGARDRDSPLPHQGYHSHAAEAGVQRQSNITGGEVAPSWGSLGGGERAGHSIDLEPRGAVFWHGAVFVSNLEPGIWSPEGLEVHIHLINCSIRSPELGAQRGWNGACARRNEQLNCS